VVVKTDSGVGFNIGVRSQQAFVRRDTIAGNRVYGVTAVAAKCEIVDVIKAWRRLLEGRKQPLQAEG
jgi:hypothetical protein